MPSRILSNLNEKPFILSLPLRETSLDSLDGTQYDGLANAAGPNPLMFPAETRTKHFSPIGKFRMTYSRRKQFLMMSDELFVNCSSLDHSTREQRSANDEDVESIVLLLYLTTIAP